MQHMKEQNHTLKKAAAIGGRRWIYENFIERLQNTDIATSAKHLDLALNDAGEAKIPFLGEAYLISNEGVRRSDGKGFKDAFRNYLRWRRLMAAAKEEKQA
jgi:hypothetical protein